jgi:Cu/Ag efflux protein CusF
MRICLPHDLQRARWCIIASSLLVFAFAISCQRTGTDNQAANTQNQAETSGQAAVKIYRGVGVIKKINPQDPSVMIAHEEIKDYMDAMTMEYHVKDKSLLTSIKPGDKVDFTIEDKQGVVAISEIKKR